FGCFTNQKFQWFQPKAHFEFGWVGEKIVSRAANGEWWLGSGAGVYRFPPARNFLDLKTAAPLAVYTTTDGLSSMQTFRVFPSSSGDVWLSTFGLAQWDHATEKIKALQHQQGIPLSSDDAPRSFGEDRDHNIWIGYNSGVARYRDGKFRFFKGGEEVPPGSIMGMFSDRRGRFWITSAR